MTSSVVRIESEYVVVGGGSAGAVVAGRLAERGMQVVLVEAGPDYGPFGDPRWPAELVDARMLATTHDWRYAAGRWTFERARVIGGCSSHNGAIAAVGHRRDYDDWALAGWSAVDVEPLFRTVLDRMRVHAYERHEAVPFHEECLQAAEALGWPIASDLCDLDAGESFGLETVNVDGTVRWNTSFAYLDPVRGGPSLRIVDRTLVDRLEATGDGVLIRARRVPGLPYGEADAFDPHLSIDRVELLAGTVVLAAGTYGTPAILQRSGVGDSDRLRGIGVEPVLDSPRVGANLHDHPMVSLQRTVGDELQRHLDAAAVSGFLPEEQTLGKFTSTMSDGLYDTHVFPVCASDQTSLLHGRVAVEVACMKPRSRGRLDITGPDPLAAPRIDHGYLSDPDGHDVAVLREGLATARELLDQPVVARLLGVDVFDADDERAIRTRVAHYYHPVGTCAMGDDAGAVCDASGRVRGLDRVFVADASLIPEIPRANTNIPTIMIGERVAASLVDATS